MRPRLRRKPPTPRRPRARTPAYVPTGAKLGRAVLGYLVLVVLVVTLSPLEFRVPDGVHLTYWTPDGRWYGAFDCVANVALFAPLGFLYALTRAAVAPDAPRAVGRALLGGLLLSVAIETTQLFEPARFSSPVDVASNATGALLGAWLYVRLARRLRADALVAGGLALELPVMGLVYVSLPLVTLAALTADGGPRWDAAFPPRPAALVALGLFGASLLGTVQRRRRGAPAAGVGAVARRAAGAAAAAALWFGVGALPALATAHRAFWVGLAAAALVAALVSLPLPGTRADERRFEAEAIARAAPFLALALALYPFGQVAAAEPLSQAGIIRALEGFCGFAVLGYLLAEAWGRRELRYRYSAGRVAAAAGAVAVAQALLANGGAADGAAALAEIAARVLCAGYGGWIYHLQRAHVRAVLDARRVFGAAPRRAGAAAPLARAAEREVRAPAAVG